MEPPEPDERSRLERLREQLPALQSSIYLNTGTSGPIPVLADAAMRELLDYELRFGRATLDAYEDLVARIAECRAVVAAILHAMPDSVALTRSTTDGLNAGLWSREWRPGDEIVTTNLEHPGLLGPLAALEERGVRVRVADVGDGGDDDRTVGAIEEHVNARTSAIALSHVSWVTGAVLPVARIAALARSVGAWSIVDGAQSAGAIDVDPAALGADFYAVPAQKWLLGPEGMGALWASGRAIDEARQAYAGWWTTDEATSHPPVSGIPTAALRVPASARLRAEPPRVAPSPTPAGRAGGAWGEPPDDRLPRLGLRPWADARRFDTTGFHRPSVVGFARSAGWLAMHVGLPWMHERSARLACAVADEIAAIPGVSVLTPRNRMATLVSFRVHGWTPDEAVEAIRRHSFATLRTLPGADALRASVGWFNSEAELGRFLDTVRLVASHTPESLPRRGDLTILSE